MPSHPTPTVPLRPSLAGALDEPAAAPVSGAPFPGASRPLSDGDALPPVPPEPTPEDRYEPGGTIGRGGMGVVEVAWDAVLRRDVALKTIEPGRPHGDRLTREARLTASLEHPGIVPVYDGGTTPDGRPFYTMRLLRGRTLADAVDNSHSRPERLALVRHVLDAAAAVAHAHRRGVLHRDLKPPNIIVGELGETVVADWGLACTLTEAEVPGSPVGTPGYAAPEQMAGGPIDQRADVYGLGAVLYECLAGGPPGAAPPRGLDAPPELIAITTRALAPAPADRYPDAEAFAADLLAWFEGRRVEAHSYGALELAGLVARRWRAPLVVAGVMATLLAAAVGIGWQRTAAQRDRALVAETEARTAAEEAEGNLAQALAGQALAAAAAGSAVEAESFANRALALRESPEARGVLARFGGRPRPHVVLERAHDCRRLALGPDGETLLCVGADDAALLRGGEVVARLPGMREAVAVAGEVAAWEGDDGRLWIGGVGRAPRVLEGAPVRVARIASTRPGLFTADASGGTVAIDVATASLRSHPPCPGNPRAGTGAARADGGWWAACFGGKVYGVDAQGVTTELAPLPVPDAAPVLLEASQDEAGSFVVGTVSGDVVVYREGRPPIHLAISPAHPVALALRGDRLAVARGNGLVQAWDLDAAELLATLHAPGARLAWADDGTLAIADLHHLRRWELPRPTHPENVELGAGVSGLDVSPDGAWVAAGLGDGTVVVLDPARGRVVARLSGGPGVVKDVAFSPDGHQLASVNASEDGVRIWDVGTWAPRPPAPLDRGRRIAWLRTGLIAATYKPPARLWSGGPPRPVAEGQLRDLEGRGESAWGVSEGGRPLRFGPDGAAVDLGGQDEVRSVCPVAEGAVALYGWGWAELAPDGSRRREVAYPNTGVDIAATARWVAIAQADGTVPVFGRDGTLRATLFGHSGRVNTLEFSLDGAWLYSGSWTGGVRTWAMSEL